MMDELAPRPLTLYHRHNQAEHPATVSYSVPMETYRIDITSNAETQILGSQTLGTKPFQLPTLNTLLAELNLRGLHTTARDDNTPLQNLELIGGRIISTCPKQRSSDQILNALEFGVQRHHGDIEIVGLPHQQNSSLYLVGHSGNWARLEHPEGAATSWGSGDNLDTARLIVDTVSLETDNAKRFEQALGLARNWLDRLPPTAMSATLTSISSTITAEDEPRTALTPDNITAFRSVSQIDLIPPTRNSLQIR